MHRINCSHSSYSLSLLIPIPRYPKLSISLTRTQTHTHTHSHSFLRRLLSLSPVSPSPSLTHTPSLPPSSLSLLEVTRTDLSSVAVKITVDIGLNEHWTDLVCGVQDTQLNETADALKNRYNTQKLKIIQSKGSKS